MSDSAFKTPLSHHTIRSNDLYTPKTTSDKSDSEESTTSEASCGSTNDLTVVALFDDLIRLMRYKRDKKTEESFLNFAEESKLMFEKYLEAVQECQRLRTMLDLKVEECSETERRVNTARHFLDEEKKKTQRVIREKEELEEQLDLIRELLFKDNRVKIADDAKEKLSFLNNKRSTENQQAYTNMKNLSCIQEINSTGSMLSDYSVSRSEDDLDISRHGNPKWKKHRASTGGDLDPPIKKRKSATNKVIEIGPTDTVRATTTVTVNKKGPITATSIIESIPKSENGFVSDEAPPSTDDGFGSTAPNGPPPNLIFESWAKNSTPKKNNIRNSNKPDQRQHNFQIRNVVLPDSCICCEKRIRFGKSSLKCKDCRSICHVECKDLLPLPCVPVGNTPNHKNILGVISDFTPTIPPMVPALIVHCTNEIELRGLNELGLYRLSASEKEVKSLKEKFLKGRGSPSISQTDIHVLCGCVKDFLRNLAEPLVTYALWHDFARSVDTRDPQDTVPALYQCIAQLPQPNRDTLAYLMVHLQKISEAPECKMPIENLAKVFGPTLVKFSSDNPSNDCLLAETRLQIQIVDQLIRLPYDYWSSFIDMPQQFTIGRMQQTPSTDSLLRPTGRFFTPRSKNKRFNTPPAFNNVF